MSIDQDPLSGPAGFPGGGALVSLARLLARQAAAEAWAGPDCGGEHDAGPIAGVADHHEQKRNADGDE